ncbi:MAG TPA: hypothetical protein V6D07_15455 [Trichocoleus sp.]
MSTDDVTQPENPNDHLEPSSNSNPAQADDAHVSGTGLGALGGTTLATAAGGAVGGPVGAVVGAVVGSIAGGVTGNRVAEALDSAEEKNASQNNDTEQDDQ